MNHELIKIVDQLIINIRDSSDMSRTRYENASQLKDELINIKESIKSNDKGGIEDLNILLLPTGSLQEHAISNEWTDTYLKLSADFDKIYSTR